MPDHKDFVWIDALGEPIQIGDRVYSLGNGGAEEQPLWAGVVVDGTDPADFDKEPPFDPGTGPSLCVERDDGVEGGCDDDAWAVMANLTYVLKREVVCKDRAGTYLSIGDRIEAREPDGVHYFGCVISYHGGSLSVVREDHLEGGGKGIRAATNPKLVSNSWLVNPEFVEKTRHRTSASSDTLPAADPFTAIRDPLDFPQDMIDYYHNMVDEGVQAFASALREKGLEFTDAHAERCIVILKQIIPFYTPHEGFVISMVLKTIIMHSQLIALLERSGVDFSDDSDVAQAMAELIKSGGGLGVDPTDTDSVRLRLGTAIPYEKTESETDEKIDMDAEDPADRIMRQFNLSDN